MHAALHYLAVLTLFAPFNCSRSCPVQFCNIRGQEHFTCRWPGERGGIKRNEALVVSIVAWKRKKDYCLFWNKSFVSEFSCLRIITGSFLRMLQTRSMFNVSILFFLFVFNTCWSIWKAANGYSNITTKKSSTMLPWIPSCSLMLVLMAVATPKNRKSTAQPTYEIPVTGTSSAIIIAIHE